MSLINLGKFKVTDVADGDTITVDRPPFAEITKKSSLRLLNIDTEETSNSKFLGPVTEYAKEVKYLAKEWFDKRGNEVELFSEETARCGFFGRALVYVFVGGEHYQEYAIQNGWTPYYAKYGYAHEDCHAQLVAAQEDAIKNERGIWSKKLRNRPENESRPYDLLLEWWKLRADEIAKARELKKQGKIYMLLNAEDYDTVVTKAQNKEYVQIFGELDRPPVRGGLFTFKVAMDKSFAIYVSKEAKNRDHIIKTLEDGFISNDSNMPKSILKPNYVFLKGHLEMYKKENRETPELIIYDENQIGLGDIL